jgi:hypothetical protein
MIFRIKSLLASQSYLRCSRQARRIRALLLKIAIGRFHLPRHYLKEIICVSVIEVAD